MTSTDARMPAGAGPHVPTVVVLGDGQLGRMLVTAGRRLAIEVVTAPVHAATPPPPGAELRAALDAAPDVVTVEIELIAPDLLRWLQTEGYVVRPDPDALALADKAHQRGWMRDHGFPVPPFAPVHDIADVERFAAHHGWPLVLKRSLGGYDGRGVAVLEGPGPLPFPAGDGAPTLVVEPHLPLERELAAVVVRSPSGEQIAYPVVETVQHDGQCHAVLAPAAITADMADRATDLALRIAQTAGVVGVLALELFVVDGDLLVNEIALRPHNSAHYTIDACVTSQFENHLRAVLDLPLGSGDLRSPAAMVNVVSRGSADPRHRLAGALRFADAHVHLYAKSPRPGRKLGHVTVLGDDVHKARARAEAVVDALVGRP